MQTFNRAPSRRAVAAAVTITALVGGAALAATPASARTASGGAGRYVSQIQWMDFGSPGQAIPSDGTTRTTEFELGGQPATFSCTISDVAGAPMTAYVPGSWRGDALDDLYNIDGTGTANTFVNALSVKNGGTATFSLDCSATVAGRDVPLAGLVFADAEQNTVGEYVAATASAGATWRIIDRYRSAECGDSTRATVDGSRLELAGSPDPDETVCESGPSAVAFLDGATSASEVALHGGGSSAIAVGAMLGVSEAPTSGTVGAADHLQQPTWHGGDVIGTGTRVSDDDFVLGTPEPATPRLGASSTASDGIRLPDAIEAFAGQEVSVPFTCTGDAATVAGWVDWDGDGVMQADERAATTCAEGDLTWTVPADVTSGDHAVRVRIASDADQVEQPAGLAVDGEVETDTVRVDALAPSATDDFATTEQNTAVTVDVLANDEAASGDLTLDPASVRLVDDGDLVDELATDDGTASVEDGRVVVRPAPGFSGTFGPITYSVTDASGTRATATVTVEVAAVSPVAHDDAVNVRQGASAVVSVLDDDTAGNAATPIDRDSLRILDGTVPVEELDVDGEGRWSVRDGDVTFEPLRSFSGVATQTYRVADVDGAASSAAVSVTVDAVVPRASDDTATVRQGGAVSVDVLHNDAAGDTDVPLDPSTLQIVDGGEQAAGTFEVQDGKVVFTPLMAFSGDAAATYSVADANGTITSASVAVTVEPVVPVATEDLAATQQGDSVVTDVLANDEAGDVDVPIDVSTLRLVAGEATVTETTIPGVGAFVIEDGSVRFSPEPTFIGSATIGYDVADGNGTHMQSDLTVTVAPIVPTLADDRVETDQAVPVTLDVLANDVAGRPATPLDPGSLRLVMPGASDDAGARRLVEPGVGSWSVTDDDELHFEPETDFAGTGLVTYAVRDRNGTEVSATATVVVVPAQVSAEADHLDGVQGGVVSGNPLTNDTATRGGALDPRSVRFTEQSSDSVRVRDHGRTAIVDGQGTWRIDPETGVVSFAGAPDFVGTTHVLHYSVANEHGVTADATIDATMTARPAELAFTGAHLGAAALAAVVLLALGGLLMVRRRRI